jgi:ATP-binding cassette subfamily C exporter for protease/lipase
MTSDQRQQIFSPALADKTSELRSAINALKPFAERAGWFSLVTSVLALTSTVYMLQVYERVVNSRNLTTLVMLTVIALAAYLVLEVLEWVRLEIMSVAAKKFDDSLAERIFAAIFQADLRWVSGASQEALNDLRTLRDFIASPALIAVMDAPMSLLLLGVIFLISPVLGWFAVLGGVIQVFLGYLTERRSQPPLLLANKAAIAAQAYANGVLRNAQVIEAMGMLPGIRQRWMTRQRECVNAQAIASEHAGGLMAGVKLVQLVQASALLGLGCWLFLQGELAGGGGMMIVASILGGKVLQPLVLMVSSWRNWVNARDAFARLDQLLQRIPVREPAMPLPPPGGELRVEGVVASAPGSNFPIIRNISFVLAAGQTMAIIGPSAAGKTTLARLLIGVWPASSGTVRLDGADVFAWNKAQLGPYVGYLPQAVALLDGTLAENITRFGRVDPEKLAQAIRLAGLEEWVAALPDGVQARMGDDGAFLSGGLRQRVGLARAIYGTPRFVVLDEPNSNLDEAGEAALMQTLHYLKASGVTVLVITHRLGVLAAVDQLLLLREGSVQACGPRDEVLAAMAAARSKARPAQSLQVA